MERAPQTINVSWTTLAKVVLVVLGLWFLWLIRDIVAMLVAAVLLAALIRPFADWFARRHVPRVLSVLVVYLVLGGLIAAVAILLVPVVIEQSIQLFGSSAAIPALTDLFANTRALLWVLQDVFLSFIRGESSSVSAVFGQVRDFLGGLAALVVVLVLTFYMVVEDDTARKLFRNLAPIEYQPFLAQLFTKMQTRIGAWLQGQILLGIIVGSAAYLGLSLLGVKYALLFAVIAGLLEIVPYVGPTLSLVPAAIVGFAHSPFIGFAVIALYLAIQQVENHLLVPKVMQKVTGLNPIVSIVALLVGVKLGGFVGAVLSIPVATMCSVALEDLFCLDTNR
jgi:predicted PurR-regulated permease PerM